MRPAALDGPGSRLNTAQPTLTGSWAPAPPVVFVWGGFQIPVVPRTWHDMAGSWLLLGGWATVDTGQALCLGQAATVLCKKLFPFLAV